MNLPPLDGYAWLDGKSLDQLRAMLDDDGREGAGGFFVQVYLRDAIERRILLLEQDEAGREFCFQRAEETRRA